MGVNSLSAGILLLFLNVVSLQACYEDVLRAKPRNVEALVQLAHARAMREEFVQPWELEPIYLRQPDAEINWSTRAGGA